MKTLLATWPRRLILAVLILLLASAIAVILQSSHMPTQPLNTEELMKRIVILPALLAIAVFALTSALVSRQAIAATSQNVTASTAGPDHPFKAQVVGLEWLNPLQRRDYPTEWQLLWTLGLVKPNPNDDMVRTDPTSFTTLKSVAGIADGDNGEETFKGYHHKYIDKLFPLFSTNYVMDPYYFYTVQSSNRSKWREVAGIHVEYAIPAERLDPTEAGNYLRDQIIDEFEIGNSSFTDLWTKSTPPDVHVTPGGQNAGFTSLNAALDYLQANPKQSVWVMNWDAPSFPPKDSQINENLVLLILAGPELNTEREPLAWIGRAATQNVDDFEAKQGTTRAAQAWQASIEAAAHNAGSTVAEINYVVHDAGAGNEVSADRIGALGRTLMGSLMEFDFHKQTFNTPALLGEMGAGTALTDVALAIAHTNHFGGNVLVAGTTDPKHPTAVVVTPPAKLTMIDPDHDWFRARGEDNAYLPWWGHRHDAKQSEQGYSE